jgi:hypothetical protein
VGHADDRGPGDLGMPHGHVLEVDGADPLTAGLDEVLLPVGDLHAAARVDRGHVAGGEPALGVQGAPRLSAQVGGDHPGTPDLELARSRAVVGQRLAAVIDDAQLHAELGPALHHEELDPLLFVQVVTEG